jgi:hypothetical protein
MMLDTKNRIASSFADELRSAISGPVALPGEELYDEGSRVWNGAVRRRPAIIAFCKQSEDVQAAVRAAHRQRQAVAPRGTHHRLHVFGLFAERDYCRAAAHGAVPHAAAFVIELVPRQRDRAGYGFPQLVRAT